MKDEPGTVYLLHFSTPVGHAGHYIGWAKNLAGRLKHHRNGTGGRLPGVAVARGAELIVARTWAGGTRSFERQLHNRHGLRDLCPLCVGEAAYGRAPFVGPPA